VDLNGPTSKGKGGEGIKGEGRGSVGVGREGRGGDEGRDGREGDERGVLWSPKKSLK